MKSGAFLHSAPARYAVAALLVTAAFVLTDLLPPDVEHRLSVLFFGAVMLSAWWGGLGPGLLATGLSAAAIAWFFTPPYYTFRLSFHDVVRLALFVAIAVLVSYLNAARKAAEERHADLLLQEKLARARAEGMEWRYRALAEAAAVVARTHDAESALSRIVRLTVPRFAASVGLHVRGSQQPLITVAGSAPADGTVAAAVIKVLETRHPEVSARVLVIPLVAGTRLLGALAFVTPGDRPYRNDDVAFAEDLGHLAAVALARTPTSVPS